MFAERQAASEHPCLGRSPFLTHLSHEDAHELAAGVGIVGSRRLLPRGTLLPRGAGCLSGCCFLQQLLAGAQRGLWPAVALLPGLAGKAADARRVLQPCTTLVSNWQQFFTQVYLVHQRIVAAYNQEQIYTKERLPE